MTQARSKRPPSKRAYHHGNLRAVLIKAVLRLVTRKGPRGFTIQDAAKLAGVAASAPYRHFKNREALLAAVAEAGFSHLADRLRESAKPTPQDSNQLEAMAIGYLRFAIANPGQFQVMFEAGLRPPDFPNLEAKATEAFNVLTTAVANTHHLRLDIEITTAGIWATVHGLSLLAIDGALTRVGFQRTSEELLRGAVRAYLDP